MRAGSRVKDSISASLDGLFTGLVVTLVLEGELDLAQWERFESLLERALTACPDRLVLHLGGLRFIDAHSISVIAATANAVQAYGGVLPWLPEAEPIARGYIAAFFEIPADSFDIVTSWPEGHEPIDR